MTTSSLLAGICDRVLAFRTGAGLAGEFVADFEPDLATGAGDVNRHGTHSEK